MYRNLALSLVLLGVMNAPAARGADLVFFLDDFITGSNGLISGTPRAEFTNLANPNQVRLTMTLDDLSSFSEFVLSWYFNVNPLFESSPGLSFAYDAANSNGPGSTTITQSVSPNNVSPTVGEAGQFDFMFNFTSSNSGEGAKRLNPPEYVSYVISRSGGLRASDFNFFTTSGYFTAAHLGGLSDGRSVKIGALVPEPGLISFLGVCAAGIFVAFQRRRKHTDS